MDQEPRRASPERPPPPVATPVGHRLGPLVSFPCFESPVFGRLYAGGVAAAAIAVLWVSVWLEPSRENMGTHRQLGLPPCGFITMTGLPCPTCGMTTAFAHTVRGHLCAAIRSQAAGFALAVGTLVAALTGLWSATTGRYPAVNWYRVNPVRLIWLATLGFVLAWGLKIGLGLMDGTLPAR